MDIEEREALGRLGERLRELRNASGLTQEHLAEQLDLSVEHISYLERGERAPSFETLFRLGRALMVPLPTILDIDESGGSAANLGTLPSPDLPTAPSAAVTEPVRPDSQRATDLERLSEALAGVQLLQQLATEYGIQDVFQDNGGKVLQVLIVLGLRGSPGREGSDAVDAEGNEYELKTMNVARVTSVTTHHHLNKDILRKYRAVKAWYIAIYNNIELWAIYHLGSEDLEPKFGEWEKRLNADPSPINNPKIPVSLVVRAGTLVYGKPYSAAEARRARVPRKR